MIEHKETIEKKKNHTSDILAIRRRIVTSVCGSKKIVSWNGIAGGQVSIGKSRITSEEIFNHPLHSTLHLDESNQKWCRSQRSVVQLPTESNWAEETIPPMDDSIATIIRGDKVAKICRYSDPNEELLKLGDCKEFHSNAISEDTLSYVISTIGNQTNGNVKNPTEEEVNSLQGSPNKESSVHLDKGKNFAREKHTRKKMNKYSRELNILPSTVYNHCSSLPSQHQMTSIDFGNIHPFSSQIRFDIAGLVMNYISHCETVLIFDTMAGGVTTGAIIQQRKKEITRLYTSPSTRPDTTCRCLAGDEFSTISNLNFGEIMGIRQTQNQSKIYDAYTPSCGKDELSINIDSLVNVQDISDSNKEITISGISAVDQRTQNTKSRLNENGILLDKNGKHFEACVIVCSVASDPKVDFQLFTEYILECLDDSCGIFVLVTYDFDYASSMYRLLRGNNYIDNGSQGVVRQYNSSNDLIKQKEIDEEMSLESKNHFLGTERDHQYVMVSMIEPLCREYQMKPERTHPIMSPFSDLAHGFVVTATKVRR